MTDRDNAEALGLNHSAKLMIGGIPTLALDYSPLWDINLGR